MIKTNYIIYYVLLFYSMSTMAQVTTESSFFRLDSENPVVFNDDKLSFSHSDSLDLNSNLSIESLALSGLVKQSNHDSFIRVILKDTEGTEYVVLESSRLYNDVDTLMLFEYCEETKYLPMVYPKKLLFYLKNSSVDSLRILLNYPADTPPNKLSDRIAYQREMANLNRTNQSQIIANNINENNRKHNRLWRAEATDLSKMPWRDRKKKLSIEGNSNSAGFEYYTTGIFEVGDPLIDNPSKDTPITPSLYVDSFDWRNRHGINWMTSVKDQGNLNTCWAFASIGVTEALVNLYFNQKIDLDLSEQEIISCSNTGDYLTGGYGDQALEWIANHGVSEEEAFPYSLTNEPCENMGIYNELITINEVPFVYDYTINNNDSVKKALIMYGPLLSGYRFDNNDHAMPLVGYNTIHLGDIIHFYFINFEQAPDSFIVQSGDSRIGKTFWIFKNSWGLNCQGVHQGYTNILFNDQSCFSQPFYAKTPVTSLNYSDSNIAVTDSDGDGYFFWGIGDRPSHCPSWAPLTPDGDDSDYTKGPMDEYGNLTDLGAFVDEIEYITSNTIWA